MAVRGKPARVKPGLAVFALACLHSLLLQAQLSTADHLADPGSWPTQDSAERGQYAGSAACASCHAAKVASQQATSMARTAQPADASSVLHHHPRLNFVLGKYRYEIKTSAKESIYTITDGNRTRSAGLLWAFGTGDVAQSYLFKQEDGSFDEARVTYFGTLSNLHFTQGRALASPKDIDEAMYRPVPISEIGRCFACHTTASNIAANWTRRI